MTVKTVAYVRFLILGRIAVLCTMYYVLCRLLLQTEQHGLSSVAVVSPAKTAELMEMLFGLWAQRDPRNHMLDGGPDRPMGRGNFEERGEQATIVKYRDAVLSCAKMAEPIKVPFGLWTHCMIRIKNCKIFPTPGVFSTRDGTGSPGHGVGNFARVGSGQVTGQCVRPSI